ncbi:uncharacterized protein BX664DRAFT_310118 [Halteromyces radiatus]|uniref:uncharacterized protein n=1 Tax=Halteromyces radiatus TaxID=101107 RepID=UPI00221F9048|nr:uncharacterized protein BX664DRAFT_310118 [Halteromyces radiatus]KAI8099117.1 hypothetical protein BX664DRAFT_310118 [Halteromyces radiatus]
MSLLSVDFLLLGEVAHAGAHAVQAASHVANAILNKVVPPSLGLRSTGASNVVGGAKRGLIGSDQTPAGSEQASGTTEAANGEGSVEQAGGVPATDGVPGP